MYLQDQRCALEWLQDYARLFHCDPKRVTLGGLSAGAFSAHVQLNFELLHGDDDKPLFSNVWLQSNAIPAQPKTLDEGKKIRYSVCCTVAYRMQWTTNCKTYSLLSTSLIIFPRKKGLIDCATCLLLHWSRRSSTSTSTHFAVSPMKR